MLHFMRRRALTPSASTLGLLLAAAATLAAGCGDDTTGPSGDVMGGDGTITTCSSDCLELGASSCAAGGLRTCELTMDGCLTWGPVAACPGTTTCSLGVCSETCQDECAAAGTPVCEGNSVRTCGQFDADACLDFGDSIACPAGGSCSNGACSTTCQDECSSEGARECVGEGARTCGNFDGDSCLEWSAVAACANSSNTCEVSTCREGSCAVIPAAEGLACSTGPCSSGGVCADGTCVGANSGCGPGEACIANACQCETVINAGNGVAAVPLLVEAVDVVLSLRINGQPAPTNLPSTELGEVRIRHKHSDTWTYVGALGGAMAGPGWRLIPGEYDVDYRRSSAHTWRDGILTPENPATTTTAATTLTIPKTGGAVAIDVAAANVTFKARINGQPAPTNLAATEQGALYIRHEGSSEWIAVGTVGGQMIGPNWRLLTGRYTYQYRRGAQFSWREGVLTPENTPTVLGTFDITAAGGQIDLNLNAATVTFQARINGQPAPTNLPEAELGGLYLRHRGATEWTLIGALGGQMIGPDWRLITGEYDVAYEHGPNYAWRDGILPPENPRTVFTTIQIPAAGGEIQIPLEAGTVTFQARVNGQPAPTNLAATEVGVLSVKHRGATEWTDIGLVGGAMGGPTWRLVTGTYDVQYRYGQGHSWRDGILTPENGETVTGTIVVTPNGGLIPVNITAATVTFQARINGQPAPNNLPETELGQLQIRHQGASEWLDLGYAGRALVGPNWRLLTGTYDVQYSHVQGYDWREGILLPENTATGLGELVIAEAGGQISINIPAANATFTTRLNGQPGPTTLAATEHGGIAIRHRNQGSFVNTEVLGAPANNLGWRLLQGDYFVRYTTASAYNWRAGILTPENKNTVTSCFRLVGP